MYTTPNKVCCVCIYQHTWYGVQSTLTSACAKHTQTVCSAHCLKYGEERKKREYGPNLLHQWSDTIIQQSIGKVLYMVYRRPRAPVHSISHILYLYFAVLSCPIIDEASCVHIHASFSLAGAVHGYCCPPLVSTRMCEWDNCFTFLAMKTIVRQ